MVSSSATILIIDNDEGMVAALEARLADSGYRCITARTGAQGIAAFREQAVDLVITDLNMPGGDGIALIGTLRKTSDVPVLVITGFNEEYRRDLRSVHGVTVLRKPFETSQLLDLVEADLALSGCEPPVE